MNDSKSLCLIPWLHRFTTEQGFHKLCCMGISESNTLRDGAGQPLHIDQGLTDAEVLNSPDMKAVRTAMLRGEWPAACRRCQRTEETGGISVRQGYDYHYGSRKPELLAHTAPDGTLAHPAVRFADIRLGNVCNLTCRMCDPAASRLWAEHYNAVQPPRFRMPQDALTVLRNSNWVKHQPVQWLLAQCLPTVETLNFAGGEPMMIPEMIEALEQCIASGRAGEIRLQYNTNLTVLPEKVTRLWPHFRQVGLIVSIDGFGPVNDYIRRPSQWRDIDRHLHLLEENFDRWKIGSVMVSAAVQTYNVLDIGNLLQYLSTTYRRIAPIPQLIPLLGPEYLSIQMLPAEIKAAAREHLLAAREHARILDRPDLHFLTSTFDATLAHLDQPAGSARPFAEFLYFSEMSDRQFGDSWRSACPQLSKLLPPGWGAAQPAGV